MAKREESPHDHSRFQEVNSGLEMKMVGPSEDQQKNPFLRRLLKMEESERRSSQGPRKIEKEESVYIQSFLPTWRDQRRRRKQQQKENNS
jgi:hypothetical protein